MEYKKFTYPALSPAESPSYFALARFEDWALSRDIANACNKKYHKLKIRSQS